MRMNEEIPGGIFENADTGRNILSHKDFGKDVSGEGYETIQSKKQEIKIQQERAYQNRLRNFKQEYFYGSIDDYPEELRKKIMENSEILYSLEKDIINDRKHMNDMDIIFDRGKHQEFIEKEIGYDNLQFSTDSNMETNFGEFFSVYEEKCKTDIINKGYSKEVQDFLLKFAAWTSKFDIYNNENTEYFFPGYKNLIGGTAYTIGENGENNILDVWKNFIQNVMKIFSPYLAYIPKKIFDKFVKNNIFQIIGIKKEKVIKERLENLNKYLNYYCYGKDKKINLLNEKEIATIFSFDRIDGTIAEIMENLRYSENIDTMDISFINKVFVHQSDIRVLKDILQEGVIVSHNEILKRLDNENINQTQTGIPWKHKDIYFYTGYQPENIYGHSTGAHDLIFFANTMNNFAIKGYGVPLNERMQRHSGEKGYSSDAYGYSVISDSSLKDYGKIDVNDIFLFVSEKKKSEIENSLGIDSKKYKIVYIPEKYYEDNKLTDKVHAFIEKYVKEHNDASSKIVPYDVIRNTRDTIDSANVGGSRAFCKKI